MRNHREPVRPNGALGLAAIAIACLSPPSSWPAPAPDSGSPGPARPAVLEHYDVNAQYRGTIRKTYENLGEVALSYRRLAPGEFAVSLEGRVPDPGDPHTVHRFEAAVEFRRHGSVIVARTRGQFSGEAAEYRDRVFEITPFVCLVKHDPFPAPPGPGAWPRPAGREGAGDRDAGALGETTYHMHGKTYRLRYVRTPRNVEVTLYEDIRTVGKFFLLPGPQSAVHEYEKFRINAAGATVLSLVRKGRGGRR